MEDRTFWLSNLIESKKSEIRKLRKSLKKLKKDPLHSAHDPSIQRFMDLIKALEKSILELLSSITKLKTLEEGCIYLSRSEDLEVLLLIKYFSPDEMKVEPLADTYKCDLYTLRVIGYHSNIFKALIVDPIPLEDLPLFISWENKYPKYEELLKEGIKSKR